jgi:hypothetical protein
MATKKEDMVTIKLPLDRLNDTKYVMVGTGGKIIKIPRGVECQIPKAYWEILLHSASAEEDMDRFIVETHEKEKANKE